MKVIRNPEYHKIYALEEFDSAWLRKGQTGFVIPVYLPSSVVVDKPQLAIPFSARGYRMRYVLLSDTIFSAEGCAAEGNGGQETKALVLSELWQAMGEGNGYALKGYVFLTEPEFLGNPQFSVDFDRASREFLPTR